MNMQITEQNLPITNSTLSTLITELGEECQKVLTLISQLELPSLTPNQKGDILAELLVSVVHLHTHCDDDFQELISDELEQLPDDEQMQNKEERKKEILNALESWAISNKLNSISHENYEHLETIIKKYNTEEIEKLTDEE